MRSGVSGNVTLCTVSLVLTSRYANKNNQLMSRQGGAAQNTCYIWRMTSGVNMQCQRHTKTVCTIKQKHISWHTYWNACVVETWTRIADTTMRHWAIAICNYVKNEKCESQKNPGKLLATFLNYIWPKKVASWYLSQFACPTTWCTRCRCANNKSVDALRCKLESYLGICGLQTLFYCKLYALC